MNRNRFPFANFFSKTMIFQLPVITYCLLDAFYWFEPLIGIIHILISMISPSTVVKSTSASNVFEQMLSTFVNISRTSLSRVMLV